MIGPVEAVALERTIAADLEGFAVRFLQVLAAHGPEAGESLLGGYVEWLGVDMVDALLFLPADKGRELDALAEQFLVAARGLLGGGSAAHREAVMGVIRACRGMGDGEGSGAPPP